MLTTVVTVTSTFLIGAFGAAAILALLLLLISKELASAHSEETSDLMTDSLARTLSIGILPFLAVFAVIVGVRILEVL